MEIVGLMRFRWNRFQHAIINNSVLASLSDEDVLLLAKIIALLFSNLRNSRGVSKEYLYLVDEHGIGISLHWKHLIFPKMRNRVWTCRLQSRTNLLFENATREMKLRRSSMEKWATRFDQLRINEEIRNSAVFLSWHGQEREREKKGREKEEREIRFLQLIASRTTFPGLKRCRGKIHRIESNREAQWPGWYL